MKIAKMFKTAIQQALSMFVVSRIFLLKLVFVAICTIFTAVLFESIFPNSCKSWIWFSGWVQDLIYVSIFNRR